jgi:hypothetical protein
MLNDLKETDPAAYDAVIKESNQGLNPTGVMRAAMMGTDAVYLQGS